MYEHTYKKRMQHQITELFIWISSVDPVSSCTAQNANAATTITATFAPKISNSFSTLNPKNNLIKRNT